jgi:hypothetical protein
MGVVRTQGRPTGSRRADKAEQRTCPEIGLSPTYISSIVSANDAELMTKSGGALSKNLNIVLSAGATWMLQERTMTRPESARTATGYRGKLYQDTNARKRILKKYFQENFQSKHWVGAPQIYRYLNCVKYVWKHRWGCLALNDNNKTDSPLTSGLHTMHHCASQCVI